MKCPNCHVDFFPIADHKLEQSDESVYYPFTGRCPKCKKWFRWVEIYTLDEITPPVCITE